MSTKAHLALCLFFFFLLNQLKWDVTLWTTFVRDLKKNSQRKLQQIWDDIRIFPLGTRNWKWKTCFGLKNHTRSRLVLDWTTSARQFLMVFTGKKTLLCSELGLPLSPLWGSFWWFFFYLRTIFLYLAFRLRASTEYLVILANLICRFPMKWTNGLEFD